MGTSALHLLLYLCAVGGGKRDRTADLLHAMQALSQLSYTPPGAEIIKAALGDFVPLLALHPDSAFYGPELTTISTNNCHYYTTTTWRPQGDSNPCTHRERVMS